MATNIEYVVKNNLNVFCIIILHKYEDTMYNK